MAQQTERFAVGVRKSRGPRFWFGLIGLLVLGFGVLGAASGPISTPEARLDAAPYQFWLLYIATAFTLGTAAALIYFLRVPAKRVLGALVITDQRFFVRVGDDILYQMCFRDLSLHQDPANEVRATFPFYHASMKRTERMFDLLRTLGFETEDAREEAMALLCDRVGRNNV